MLKVSLKEAASLIAYTPNVRYMLIGEPGIGKSSLISSIKSTVEKILGIQYETAYIDVPNMDLGDVAMPVVDHTTKTTKYYPNSRFHMDKPCIIMLDEFSKGSEAIKKMLHPLLEVANPRLGDVPLHKDSIIFLTGNLQDNNLGDAMKAHSSNRITKVIVSKPTSDEWIDWAIDNSHRVSKEVVAWVKNTPQALASYMDNPNEENHYIFNPKRVKDSFVSPRSLENASNILNGRNNFSRNALLAALTGTLGESAARDLQTYIEMSDELVPLSDILSSPQSATLPKNSGATAIAVFGLVLSSTEENFLNIFSYVKRLSLEWQTVFCLSMYKSASKQPIIFNSPEFDAWAKENSELLY